ncbi:Extracellular ligand-binding receptor [Porphyromonas gingivalis TDC60]|uniref:ABC transporter substrate-binding protein n=1 Tax=Porphyromonas gingivalis TaxID=837 RepID=UPI00020F0416|nr:penicillin-binding protein activator [Porphyromonas gingivalis]ATR95508.1 hypothetical protein CS546_11130 [Porphyromonas gingivalis]ATR96718.1 hypothetical protein CS548_06330 [Porphyromonas gingivalis]AUR47831.1 high-affinity leucine-specific transport system periplasmic binding [Porphyromonas gingivalis]SJL25601.1 hypothetical protein PGIN_11A_01791 [Porphyromonas gingivalis]SJL27510.1 hypothetical protein PGIN_AFR-5B1_00436 [Porphyromonas gingivalis]
MKQNMKRLLWAIFIGSIILITYFLGRSSQQDEISEEKNRIKIGAILPLTGEVAFVGEPILQAIQLRLNEYNQTAPVPIDVIVEDSKGSVSVALSILEKFNAEGIKAILGPIGSGEVLGVAPAAERLGIVLLSPSASADNITTSGDYIFRNELSDNYGATMQAQLAFNQLGWHRISILYTKNDYGVGVKNAFEEEFTKLGGKILSSISFDSGTSNFRAQIINLKRISPDAIFVVAQREYPTIIRQLRESGVSTPLYATPVLENPDFIKHAGENNMEGIIYTYYGSFDAISTRAEVASFVNAYKKTYHSLPSYYSALGYDNMGIMIEALQRASFKMENLKQALYSIKGYRGVTGDISFDKNGDVAKPVILKGIQNGKFVTLNLPSV